MQNINLINQDSSDLLSVKSLALTNFRNYKSLNLTIDSNIIILSGHNGAGKTNLLEAISLLSPGKGIRNAKNELLRSHTTHDNWSVYSTIYTPSYGELNIATGNNPNIEKEKRIVKVNGEKCSQAELSHYMTVCYLTPAQDQTFTNGSTSRRQFLDRLVGHFYSDHIKHLSIYNHSKSERTKILSMDNPDSTWLSMIENRMAEQAVAIAAARMETVSILQKSLNSSTSPFPKAIISCKGAIEESLQNSSALEAENLFINRLENNRKDDSISGRTNEGTHKSDFVVIHPQKNLPAEICSTGEQKALLLSITLANARAKKSWSGYSPIILLDEVIAHLDKQKRYALYKEILDINAQYWLTGTDSSFFADFKGNSQFLTVENATILG